MVQYHALGVLYHIRKSDRLAVNKLVAKLTRMSLKSPYAVCMLVSIKDLYDLYYVMIIKQRRVRCVAHFVCMGEVKNT